MLVTCQQWTYLKSSYLTIYDDKFKQEVTELTEHDLNCNIHSFFIRLQCNTMQDMKSHNILAKITLLMKILDINKIYFLWLCIDFANFRTRAHAFKDSSILCQQHFWLKISRNSHIFAKNISRNQWLISFYNFSIWIKSA